MKRALPFGKALLPKLLPLTEQPEDAKSLQADRTT